MKDKSKGLSIGGNMLWNTVGSVIGLAAQWLVSILIVRLSTNFDDAGAYSLAFSIYAIFVPVAVFRSDLYQLSDVERKYSPGEYLSFRLITCAGAFAAIILYSLATGAAGCFPVVCAFTFWKTSSLVISCLHTTDQVNHRMDFVGQSVALQGLVSLAMFACVFSATGNLMLTLFLMAVATLVIGLFLDLPRTRSLVDLKCEVSRKMVVDLGKSCLPIVASGLIVAAVPSLPRQFLSSEMGAAALGAYSSIASPVAIVQSGISFVYAPLIGYFSEAFQGVGPHSLKKLFSMSAVGVLVIGVVGVAGMAIVGPPVIRIMYGESIAQYLYLVTPMAISAVLLGLSNFMGDLLIAFKGYRLSLLNSAIVFLLMLAALAPMQSAFNMNGPTANSILTSVVASVLSIVGIVITLKARRRSS